MQNNIFPGWEIVKSIGSGGFSEVYKIKKIESGTTEFYSALKVIEIPHSQEEYNSYRSDGYDDESITSIFDEQVKEIVSEFELMHQFRGVANIVSFEDHLIVQNDNGIGWKVLIRMELLEPMPKWYSNNEITDETVRKIGVDICHALRLCAQRNIVHRDIKPQNIFVNDFEDFKLGDFGVARVMEHTTHATKIGTYAYMAPEVYAGKPYNHQSDIYSLGMVLYWLLNERRLPFVPLPPAVPTPSVNNEAQNRRLSGEPIPAPKYGSDELKSIVLKACSFDPKDRYATAEEFEKALRAIETHGVICNSVVNSSPVQKAETKADDQLFKTRSLFSDNIADEHEKNDLERIIEPKNVEKDYIPVTSNDELTRKIQLNRQTSENETKKDTPEQTSIEEKLEIKKPEPKKEAPIEKAEEKSPELIKTPQAPKKQKKSKKGLVVFTVVATIIIVLLLLLTKCGGESGSDISNTPSVVPEVSIETSTENSDETLTIIVPSVIGKTQEEAEGILKNAGFEDIDFASEYNDEYPAGQIFSQDIKAGESINKSEKITLLISLGSEMVEVPDVVGKTVDEAQSILESKKLKVEREYKKADGVAEGNVISQSITKGSSVKVGETVVIVVSSGRETVDLLNVVGKTKTDAETKLKSQGFEVKVVEVYDPKVETGKVISQLPAAGSAQLPGTTVTINVSKGKQSVKVTLNANGGTVSATELTVYVSTAYGTLPTPTLEGYTFMGWYTQINGGDKINSTTTVESKYSHTLYARWTREHTHSYSSTWKMNESSHWRECNCGEKKNMDIHKYSAWEVQIMPSCITTGLEKHVCLTCGYEESKTIEIQPHIYSGTAVFQDEAYHYYKCFNCTVCKAEKHNYQLGKCSDCGRWQSEGLDIKYEEGWNGARVDGLGSCTDSDIYIPAYLYDGVPVTSIAPEAFMNCDNITSVTMYTIAQTGSRAFYDCDSLTSVTYGTIISPNYIDAYAFCSCDNLSVINIPENEFGFLELQAGAFAECKKLNSICLPNNTYAIGDFAFMGCSSLTHVEIPESVKHIGLHAFYNCPQLTSLFWVNGYNLRNNNINNKALEGMGVIYTEEYIGGNWWIHVAFEQLGCGVYRIVDIVDGVGPGPEEGIASALSIPKEGFVWAANLGNDYFSLGLGDTNYKNPGANTAVSLAKTWGVGDVFYIDGIDLEYFTTPTTTPDLLWYDDNYICYSYILPLK